MVVRPKFLRWVSVAGAAAIAVSVSVAAAAPQSAGASARPAAVTGIKKINHIVVVMQENRSYDSYFGALNSEGQPASEAEPTTGNPDPLLPGTTIQPFLVSSPNVCTVADLGHSWDETHKEWDGGKMDGFTSVNADALDLNGSRTMGYFDQGVLPFYYNLANQFAIADRYFSSVLSQTFPNRFYLYAGTSFGHIDNSFPPKGGFKQKTVFQLLDQAKPKITWKIYEQKNQGVASLFSYVQQHSTHVTTIAQYYKDAKAGKLPQVAFVDSRAGGGVNVEADEHPPANVQVGQQFVHDVINGLVTSPNWSSSALFLTYDEHGGYYDHVAPPAAVKPDNIAPMLKAGDEPGAFDRYGIRVPAIVVSPYAKKHSVSHTVYDHTSILRFIETRFGLPNLTKRDKAANPMLGMFDFTKVSNPKPVLAAAPIDPAGTALCTTLNP